MTVKTTITAPTRTIIEEKLAPNPLLINFDQSVAPIQLSGKVVKDGIAITPKLLGEWRWVAENQLSFQPAADWPIGIKHRVVRPRHSEVVIAILEKVAGAPQAPAGTLH